MEQTLYKKDKNGTIREWRIQVEKDTIQVSYGTKDGKFISKTQKIKGKNTGKKNETSDSSQALLEAESKIKKKRDEGYSLSLDVETSFKSPMLAHDYSKFKSKIQLPCYTQPKLDGYRMLFIPEGGDLVTRNNKKYSVLYNTDLHKELIEINLPLDGELYVHDKDYAFENYGILRKKELKEEDMFRLKQIKYYVFDIMIEGDFQKRLKVLKSLKGYSYVKVVDTILCESEEQIKSYYEMFIKEGYEGSMIRNTRGMYSHSRSYDLLKYKSFDDAEFQVVDFSYEKNLSDDNLKPVIWKCVTFENKQFDIQSKGTRKERDLLYREGTKYIGKMLTVKFFGFTSEGIPRFPKTLRDGKSSFRI